MTLGAVLRHAGQVEMLAGDAEAAEAELRSAYDIYDRLRDTGHLASVAPDLGDALYRQGRFDEASQLAEVGERSVSPGDLDAEVRWRQLRAKLWARTGRAEEGVALAADAVRLVAGTECDDLHASPSSRSGRRSDWPDTGRRPRRRSTMRCPSTGGRGTWRPPRG